MNLLNIRENWLTKVADERIIGTPRMFTHQEGDLQHGWRIIGYQAGARQAET